MNSTTHFSAPWCLAVKVITCLTLTLLAGMSIFGALFMPDSAPLTARLLVTWIPLAIVLGTLPFLVRGYRLAPNALLIERLGWHNRFAVADVVSVEINPEALRGSLRLCGSGGLFGFFGWFRNKTLGVYRAYGTDPKRAVVIKLKQQTIVVTPDEPDRFVTELNSLRNFLI